MQRKKVNLYPTSVILFMLLLPLLSIVIESFVKDLRPGWLLIGKWLVFWAIGARLFIAGIRQSTKPSFTAQHIFRIRGTESFPIIRELGFANICIGLIALLSMRFPGWRLAAAVAGGLYFGLAGMLHLFKKPASQNELIALVSDLFLFLMMLLYCLSNTEGFK